MRLAIYHAIIPVLWLLWLGYWIVSAFGTKPVERHESRASRWGHLVPMLAGGILLGVPHQFIPLLDSRFVARGPVPFWIAVALVVIGLGFACWARASLGRNWSGTVTLKQEHELVSSGPYRIVRHPIYTGVLLAILGTALAVGEWRGLLAFVVIALGLIFKLRTEEGFMTEQFGDSYRRYRDEVPALVPFLL